MMIVLSNQGFRWALPAALLCLFACPIRLAAETAAAKNRQGNKAFGEGKYSEAEKAYLDAQLEQPGRAELLYNLGNALLKQKKYEPALQSLRQATGKGDRALQASAWHNLGNALFENGKYQDSVESYIQSLRLNPADRETKQNLELALRQLQQQKRAPGDSGDDQKQKDDQNQKSNQGQKRDPSATQAKEQKAPAAAMKENKPDSMTRDQALQILDAMQSQELNDKRRLLQQRRKATGRDW